MGFVPDYHHIVDAASNIPAKRVPTYEHLIDLRIMEDVLGVRFREAKNGSLEDKRFYFKNYCEFQRRAGYDAVSFEDCIGDVMPGMGSLYKHKEPEIRNRADFERYDWTAAEKEYKKRFYTDYEILREVMPEGMKAIGGPGNGIFECIQEIAGYENLCYIKYDDPELYADLFRAVGNTNYNVWKGFIENFSDVFCVMRFGDDLGYKCNTMISAEDIRRHVVPQYKRIVDMVHAAGKKFLCHSCGAIMSVMEDMIGTVGIDAKHSNEDQIAPYRFWVETYGDRIGNFGGIDTDIVCRGSEADVRKAVEDVFDVIDGHGGAAVGTGNSIPSYITTERYLIFNKAIREVRGEKNVCYV